MLEREPYRYWARPRIRSEDDHPDGVNCRTLIQDYFLDQHGRFIGRDALEQPGLWDRTGRFVQAQGAEDAARLRSLPHETVLLAERLRAGSVPVHDVDQYRMQLHTALLLRPPYEGIWSPTVPCLGLEPDEAVILHACAAGQGTCVWDPTTFARRYKLVAAKAI